MIPDSELDRMLAYTMQVRGRHGRNDPEGRNSFIDHASTDLPKLVDAYRELRELARDLDKLLVCYRVGKRPSDALLTRLEKKDAYLKGDAT